jgi:hypothetical protein
MVGVESGIMFSVTACHVNWFEKGYISKFPLASTLFHGVVASQFFLPEK